jgi:hypothetical protein
MRKYLSAAAILLAGLGLANADEFFGAITRVDGDKIHLTKSGTLGKKGAKPAEPEVLTAAASCKVTKGNEPVEGGLNNKLFNKATVTARITTEGEKVTQIVIFNVHPDNEFRALVKKVDGQKVTFMKMGVAGPRKPGAEDVTLTAVDGVKVMEFNVKDKTKEPTPVAGGLKNEVFSRNVMALIITDDDNKITEMRLNPPLGFGPPPPPPPPPPLKK